MPTAALRDYFRAFDIDLSFTFGPSLSADPTDSRDSIQTFVGQHAPPAGQGGPAVLVVADIGYLGSPVNGMLLDAERRGACAVFTEANGFAFGSSDSRFEVYVHEIGHMLNLTHGHADPRFTTVMNSFDDRFKVTDRSQAWNDVIAAGGSSFATRLREFFGTGTRQPLGLPMSEKCCDELITFHGPWLSKFDGQDATDLEDSGDAGRPECRLEIHGQTWAVAQPLDFTVTLSLQSGAVATAVPSVLDRTSGELVIQLQQPDGSLRALQPRQLSCTSAWRRLRPRQRIRRHDSLISDRSNLVFPNPGTYKVRALVPHIGSRSAWSTIEVGPAAGVLGAPAMIEFFRRGMPSGADPHWRELDAVVADNDLAPQLRADLASRAFGRGKRPFESLRTAPGTPSPAVAEQDALRRVAYERRRGLKHVESLHRALDHAERLFAAADAQHPTLDYLAYVRRSLLMPKARGGSR